MENSHKVAVVTGAGTGVGRSAALALFKAGYQVVMAGRRREPLDETLALAGDVDNRALVYPADVSDPAAVEALFDQTVKTYGRVDVLFNNAGINIPGVPFDEIPIEGWRNVVDVNLTGVFLCARKAFGIMKKQSPMGGRIINNGSISAHTPRPNSAAYSSTKHAIIGLTKCIALDGRPHDIACSQLDIGNAVSPMTERMTEGVPQPDGSTSVEPRMDVEHVGDAIVHMANLPLDVNILTMTIMATKMPFVGRG